MIYHGNRIKLKDGVTPEQLDEALEILRETGRTVPAVTSFFIGREFGEYDWSAIFVLADLDGYWEYLIHPAHTRAERFGMPLMEKFEAFDITDDPDPAFGAKVAELQKRHVDTDPELAKLMAGLAFSTGGSAFPPAR
ncbi:Dabb family protein [Streptomyces sp. SBT349]|uniref:Dabb family protein n=1 Tax=Streptomyces sp. SBT349 TaxID=1580539 RepID=UPI00066C093B|nr:Dabb family protein [Streptomyces sp. SBT349]